MLQLFRNFFSSKIGAAVAIGVLVLIAIAFASGDVASTGGFGGIAGGDRVATVGGERIDTSSLSQATTAGLGRMKEEEPQITMEAFLASGGLEQVLNDMIERTAVAVFGAQTGIVASDRLIDSEIAKMPAFMGPDGNFSEDIYRQMLQQRGVSESLLRTDLGQGLVARQILTPAQFGAVMPHDLAKRYASLLKERRQGTISALPSPLFMPEEKPTEKQLAAYYKENQDKFIRPERRVIRYARFGPEAMDSVPEPTESEIAFRYNANKEQYAALEMRGITQLIVPTEAAAKAVVGEVSQGKSLEAAAKEKGLATSRSEGLTKEKLRSQSSQAVANAVFAAQKGDIVQPARSDLGWHVVRLENIDAKPGRSLDQVRDELATEITAEKRRVALSELLSNIEEQVDEGGNLAEIAKEMNLEMETAAPVTAEGNIYLKAGERVPEVLDPVLDTAFAMDVNEPQLAEVEQGKTFLIYDVTSIEPSAAAPFKEITDDVRSVYMIDKASAAARKAAKQIQKQVRDGKSMAQALSSLERRLPPPQSVNMTRTELSRMQQQQQGQVPPPLGLMFNMAEGTVKILSAPNDAGWFVVSLDDIEPGKISDDDEILKSAQRELGPVVGSEYAHSLRKAIRAEIGVTRNNAGIEAVRKQLSGGS